MRKLLLIKIMFKVLREQCDQIYCILGNFLKPVATNILPKLPTLLGNFVLKVSKSYMFVVK